MELRRNTHHVYRIMYHFVWIPKVAPLEIMRIIKSISAREFFRKYPEVRKKYFWGGKLWTQSYFVETVGSINEEAIREYVRNQLKEMDEQEKRFRQLDMF